MKIYIIGFMGVGKSTIGRKIANRLNYSFIDTDYSIENKTGLKTSEIFEKYGEAHFRKLEQEELIKTTKIENAVISCGGGLPCFFDNMQIINENGISLYIKLSPQSIKTRLINSKKKRPLLETIAYDDLPKFIEELLLKREIFYNQATFTIKGENIKIEDVLELI